MPGPFHRRQFLRLPLAPVLLPSHTLPKLDHNGQEMLDCRGWEGPAAPTRSQAAIPTAWEEKNPPGLRLFTLYLFCGSTLACVFGGRQSINYSFVCSPAISASLNLNLPGLCCKVTTYLLPASLSPQLHYQFVTPLTCSLQQEPGYLP